MRARVVFTASIFLAACRHQPTAYTLAAQGSQWIVTPPIRTGREVVLPHARRTEQAGCDIRGDFATLAWRGKTARIRVAAAADPGAPDRMFTDTVKSIEAFRAALFNENCLTPAERARILTAITERFALPTTTAYQLRFGAYVQAGFVELTPDFRLKVVSPRPSGDVEVAFYKIGAAGTDVDRMRIAPDSPGVNPLPFADAANYYRVLFWTSLSSANHYATILAGENRAALTRATSDFQAQPDGSCKITLPAGATCIPIPSGWAVNAELRVSVNGKQEYAAIGATAGQVAGNQPQLHVTRMFQGRAIPVTGDNLSRLVLLPGDRISYP